MSTKGFQGPNIRGGDPIIYGSSLNFSKDIVKNHAARGSCYYSIYSRQ